MRKRSKKGAQNERVLKAIKKDLSYEDPYCILCRKHAHDLAHLLPRSTFPQYITEKWNLVLMCRECHVKFDSDKEFRKQSGLISRIEKIDGRVEDYYDV